MKIIADVKEIAKFSMDSLEFRYFKKFLTIKNNDNIES